LVKNEVVRIFCAIRERTYCYMLDPFREEAAVLFCLHFILQDAHEVYNAFSIQNIFVL